MPLHNQILRISRSISLQYPANIASLAKFNPGCHTAPRQGLSSSLNPYSDASVTFLTSWVIGPGRHTGYLVGRWEVCTWFSTQNRSFSVVISSCACAWLLRLHSSRILFPGSGEDARPRDSRFSDRAPGPCPLNISTLSCAIAIHIASAHGSYITRYRASNVALDVVCILRHCPMARPHSSCPSKRHYGPFYLFLSKFPSHTSSTV